MVKNFIRGLMLFFFGIFYSQQCYPSDAVPYTGTFDLAQSPQGNYYINSGSGSVPNVPTGFKLWITGTASYSIGNNPSGEIEVCKGGILTSITAPFANSVNLYGVTIGSGGVFNVEITGPTNLNSFFIGTLKENSVTSFCISGPVNLFSSYWAEYVGSSTGKAWVVRMNTGILNASNTTVSNSPNVLFVDYGTYSSPAARPSTPTLPEGHPDNPFRNTNSCDVAAIKDDLISYIDPPSTRTTCVKPGLNTNTVSPPKFAITTLNPDGLQDRLNTVTGSLFLESNGKGLVLPRTNTNLVGSPIAGTLIYDVTNKCVSLYDGYSWGCMVQTCIDNR